MDIKKVLDIKNGQIATGIASNCQINFGVTGLNNQSLIENFFPEDLPEDWRLSYYNNEFQLLLISLSDLNISLSSLPETKTITAEIIIERLNHLSGEIEDDFLLLFDVSMLSKETQTILLNTQKKNANSYHIVNTNTMKVHEKSDCPEVLECLFSVYFDTKSNILERQAERQVESLSCMVNNKSDNEQKISALELRKLIETLRTLAISRNYDSVNVLFSSAHHALENCRDAILLESLM